MRSKKLLSILLSMMIVLLVPVKVFAAKIYTVTFYTDAGLGTVHDTQQVEKGSHPTVPATNPATYTANGYRYEFSGWYWTIDDSAIAFSFTDDDSEIWSDAVIYAGYTQYLAEGYQIVIKYPGGDDFINDSKTPMQEILKRYPVITYVSAPFISEQGSGGDDPAVHTHTMTHTAAVPATYTTEGNIEYWYCSGCKNYYSDAGGNNKITQAETKLAKLAKKANALKLSKENKTYKRSKLKKKKSFTMTADNAGGKVTYTLNKSAKKAKIKVKQVSYKTSGSGAEATGTVQYKITVPKKCKKGTYKITVKAAGNDCYKAGEKTLKIKVK